MLFHINCSDPLISANQHAPAFGPLDSRRSARQPHTSSAFATVAPLYPGRSKQLLYSGTYSCNFCMLVPGAWTSGKYICRTRGRTPPREATKGVLSPGEPA